MFKQPQPGKPADRHPGQQQHILTHQDQLSHPGQPTQQPQQHSRQILR